jgi:hypothetical protein
VLGVAVAAVKIAAGSSDKHTGETGESGLALDAVENLRY